MDSSRRDRSRANHARLIHVLCRFPKRRDISREDSRERSLRKRELDSQFAGELVGRSHTLIDKTTIDVFVLVHAERKKITGCMVESIGNQRRVSGRETRNEFIWK